MAKITRQLLAQEVSELTALLRHDPAWEELRDILRQKGFVPETCLLAGFMESEDGQEWGAVVAHDGTAFEYELDMGNGKKRAKLIRWSRVEDVAELTSRCFPALTVGVELARANVFVDVRKGRIV